MIIKNNIFNIRDEKTYIKDIKGIKSAMDLKEQEARIAKLQKEAEADADKNSSVSITIEGGDDEWQN